MSERRNQNDLVFLLGAGASIEAGVPDTRKFIYGENEKDDIQGFIEWLKENDMEKELEVLENILNIFKERNDSPFIDVELVLGVLNALNNKEKYDLVYFYDRETFKFKSKDEVNRLRILEKNLKKIIREKVVVRKDDINYLDPLIEFQKPINIFSVNYDTCIEMLCMKHELTYTDGFELYWNPELFEKNVDVKLFKIHGSIIWYLTNRGNYVKLPLEIGENDEIHLISGEIASPFILYPIGRKWEYTEPLEHLAAELRKYLKNAEICIVVGYSFRDDDIRRIFFEAAKKNTRLTIVLISPNAGEIFKDRLRYLDIERLIPSPISEKVICFNYPFGSVLRDNYLYRCCKNDVPQIKRLYTDAVNVRREGGDYKKQFKDCINHAIEIGDVSTVGKIFENELGLSPPDSWGHFDEKERFRLSYSLAIFHLLNGNEKRVKFFDFLVNSLQDVLCTGKKYFDMNVELSEQKEKGGNDGKIKEIESSIKELQKEYPYSTFYYWCNRSNSDLKHALASFEVFIQLQLKLRATDDNISLLLSNLLDASRNLLSIFNTEYDSGKYKDTEKVDVDGIIVEIQRKIDLENSLEDFIKSIDDFIGLHEQK